MGRKRCWVKCDKCKRIDRSINNIAGSYHTGTLDSMRCPDCAGPDGRARLCRGCCPTGHGTRLMDACFEEHANPTPNP